MYGRGMADDEHDDAEHDAVADADAMADQLEDELADELTEPTRQLPIALVIPAAILTAAIAAPLTPDGHSFAQLLYAAFLRHPLEGVITLLGFGSPFCFGAITLLLAAADRRLLPAMGERMLVVNLSFLHAQLLLVAGLLLSRGQGMLSAALLGFAIVSGGYFTVYHARTSAAAGGVREAGPRGPTQRWLVRWGATIIVAICGWIRLQVLIDVRFGWAIELMLGACMMMAVLLKPSSGSTPPA
jgi:hypothetical protein